MSGTRISDLHYGVTHSRAQASMRNRAVQQCTPYTSQYFCDDMPLAASWAFNVTHSRYGNGSTASAVHVVDLVNIWRYCFATHAHTLTVDQIAILAEGQSAYNHALLGCYHCTAT